ncbi:MAG: pyridoxal phosphate-dependent aminotransferase [Rhodospirillaceae bacterium]|nr:pyridoxal phosphate-dependent aminotransferase [Rhodospirillaceae bacterium]
MGAIDLLASINPRIASLPESGIVELVNYGREIPDLIPLWVGEGDLATPDFISDAAIEALRDGQTFYTYQRGIPPLRQALGEYLKKTYGVDISPERTIVTIGGMQATMETVQMLLGPGDEIVAPSPVWPNIKAAVDIVGGQVINVPLQNGNAGWTLDLDRLFDSCGHKTKAFFLNSPSNPTAWIMTREDQISIRDFAREHGLWIIADEVYGRMVYEMDVAPSFLQICEPDDRLVVINTFSKNWSMTGWRIGWLVMPEALGQVYENLVQFNTSGVPTFLQHGAVAALEKGEHHVREMIARCRQGRDIVCDALEPLPNVHFARPGGSFYMLLSVDGEMDGRALAYRLVNEANVGLAPGSAFGEDSKRYMRLCFGVSLDKLKTAIERLVPILSEGARTGKGNSLP